MELNDVSADDNDDSSIPATIVIESYPFEPIAANDRSGSYSQARTQASQKGGYIIYALDNDGTWTTAFFHFSV